VGRGKELHTLESLLDGLGGGRFLAIEGEPGIGKSRLLSELIALAEDRRMLPLAGRAAAVEADVPFAPLRDALDDYVASRDPRELEPAGATGRTDLARVLPALGGEPSLPPPGEERYRAHHAVRALLDGLAARRPVLLALDDLQWADGASAELLAHLLRHPPRRKVAVALAWRAGQCPPALAAAVAEAARAGDVETIELRPLGPRDSRSLIAATTSASRLDPILRLAEGNPFYLSELSRSWGAEADPKTPEGGVPAAVAAAIVAELEEVPANARALARAGSVLGEEFEAAVAAEVGAVTEPASAEALDALLERDLVRRTDSPRRFAFRHPIVRESVYESMPAGERSRLHGDAADALERAGADLTARAPHVEESASAPDASAAALLNKAGMEAMASAPSAAAHWLTAALELTPPGDSGTRLAHLIALARALAGCGEYERALDALEEILSLLPADELRGRARAVAAIAEVLALLGRHGEAHQQLVAGLAALPAAATAEATLLRLQLAADAFYSADFEGMDLQVTAALADAEARGDRSIIAAATGLRSASLYLRDRVPEARGELDVAIRAPALTRLDRPRGGLPRALRRRGEPARADHRRGARGGARAPAGAAADDGGPRPDLAGTARRGGGPPRRRRRGIDPDAEPDLPRVGQVAEGLGRADRRRPPARGRARGAVARGGRGRR
jgi:predicted ATPase